MKCNITPLLGFLIAALAFALMADSMLVAAAIANNSFWLALGTPAISLLAGACAAAAGALLLAAVNALNTYCQCLEGNCAGDCNNLANTLKGAAAVMFSEATACAVASGFDWIPWVGAAPIYVIIATVVLQIPLIIMAISFTNQLATCGQSATPVGSGPSPTPVGG